MECEHENIQIRSLQNALNQRLSVLGNLICPLKEGDVFWHKAYGSNAKRWKVKTIWADMVNMYVIYRINSIIVLKDGGEGKLKGKQWGHAFELPFGYVNKDEPPIHIDLTEVSELRI
jgi:hypothetical protein